MPVTVLVIDDDVRFRSLAARMLSDRDVIVVGEAGSVAAAVEAAHELRPEAALVDIGLPDGDGLELARRLAALPWSPRVVLTSSDRDATTREDAIRAGAAAFVPKDDLPDAEVHRLLAGDADLEYG
jgi:DNA-binding NarL/FixJ family response regulator